MIPACRIYAGSDGEATKAYYAALERRGIIGTVAMNLFRAQKCSARAKVYHGRGFRRMAYDRKSWSIEQLCRILVERGAELGIAFGWKEDAGESFARWVLYVDLPHGQVSFHCPTRYAGPDYPGDWDGQRQSAERVLAFCDAVMAGRESEQHQEPLFRLPVEAF